MAASTTDWPAERERDLLGQSVLVIGGSSGIGLETRWRSDLEGRLSVAVIVRAAVGRACHSPRDPVRFTGVCHATPAAQGGDTPPCSSGGKPTRPATVESAVNVVDEVR